MTNYEYYAKNGVPFNNVSDDYQAFCKNNENVSFDKWIQSERKFEQKFKIGDIICHEVDDYDSSVIIGFDELDGIYSILTMDCFVRLVAFCKMNENNINGVLENYNYNVYADDIQLANIQFHVGTLNDELKTVAEAIGKHYATHH